jgi:hypothetical protein
MTYHFSSRSFLPGFVLYASMALAWVLAGCVESVPSPYETQEQSVRSSRPECATDADCQLHESYCADRPCVCESLPVRRHPRHCRGNREVACLVSPCDNQSAACVNGQCGVVYDPVK